MIGGKICKNEPFFNAVLFTHTFELMIHKFTTIVVNKNLWAAVYANDVLKYNSTNSGFTRQIYVQSTEKHKPAVMSDTQTAIGHFVA